MFESAHSQTETSGECPAIDIPKTFTNNVFLKTGWPSPPQGVDVAALEAGLLLHGRLAQAAAVHSGSCWQLKLRWGAAAAPGPRGSAGTGSAPLRTGAPLPGPSWPERLPQAGRDHEPAGEAPSHRLNQFCCLLRPETWRCSPFTRSGLQPVVSLCLSSPARAHSSSDGLGGCSSVRLWSREGQMQNNRFQKGGILQNLPFIPSSLFSPHLQFELWLPCHRRLRIYLGRDPGAAARLSFQGSSPGKVTRG